MRPIIYHMLTVFIFLQFIPLCPWQKTDNHSEQFTSSSYTHTTHIQKTTLSLSSLIMLIHAYFIVHINPSIHGHKTIYSENCLFRVIAQNVWFHWLYVRLGLNEDVYGSSVFHKGHSLLHLWIAHALQPPCERDAMWTIGALVPPGGKLYPSQYS